MLAHPGNRSARTRSVGTLCLLALGCALLLTSCLTWAYDTHFKRTLMDEVIDDANIGSIVALEQDRQGFIWVGGELGLARYDGQKAKRYSLSTTAAAADGTYIHAIKTAPNGTVWVATAKGVSYLSPGQYQFHLIQPFPTKAHLNRVGALAIDANNKIILGRSNGVSIYDPTQKLFKHFDLPKHTAVTINTLATDHLNNLWIGTNGHGAVYLNRKTHQFSFYQHAGDNPGSLANNYITMITQDHLGRVWMGTRVSGISRLDPGSQSFKHFKHDPSNPKSLGHNAINHIYEDSEGLIWVATDHGGLALFNEQSEDFKSFKHNDYNSSSLASNQLRTIIEDKSGDLWVGSFPASLNHFNRSTLTYKNFRSRPDDSQSLSHSSILCFLQDSSGHIWVGTENGLNRFNQKSERFTRYMSNQKDSHSLQAGSILSLAEDQQKQIWVGTWSGGLHKFDRATGKFKNYFPSDTAGSIQSAFIWSLTIDRKNRLWIGTEGAGLSLYHPTSDTFEHFTHNVAENSINHNYVWSTLEDHQGQIWVGTTSGLNRFDPETRTFFNFPRKPNDPSTVDSDRIRALYQDSKNNIWVGTQEAGLYIYNFTTKTFRNLNTASGLPSEYITGFIEDNAGDMWATTSKGVARIAANSLEVTVFNKNHGLASDNFYRPATHKSPEGLLFLGSADGFSIFNPREATQYPANAEVFFTGVSIPGRPEKTAAKIINNNSDHHLTLSYLDSVFSIEFSALDYRSGGNKRYAYRLKGFDDQWTESKTGNLVTYTNLSPGAYEFIVKAGTLAGWSSASTTLNLTITPPPWKTWWAYSLYLLGFIGIGYLIVHAKIKQYQLAGEREVNNQLRSLNAMKDAFLANTSHELRTPLNGIIGIAETLRDRDVNRDAFTNKNLSLIISCGKRLASLINDILDYSKLTNKSLELNIEPVDIYTLVQAVFTLLEPLTKNKDISLLNNIEHLAPIVLADENRLQQILINLIGNSIKYTPEGLVIVDLKSKNQFAYITIQDTGVGIPVAKQGQVFEAFTQLENNDSRRYDGTGLGLAITRQLVELHGGDIWIDSKTQNGSTFTFTLPLANGEHANLRPTPKIHNILTPTGLPIAADEGEHKNPHKQTNQKTILIVDDDAVNQMVLEGLLQLHNFHTLCSNSGRGAIELVQINPAVDLVIMDVMMPGMSGYEACVEIRKSHNSNDLPILFLSAKSTAEQAPDIEAIGGNGYLPKPVNKTDLLKHISNLLRT